METTTLDPAWSRALASFDASLSAHGMAEKTRRAYGVDLGQLAEWASKRQLGPLELDARELRRYAAVLSEGGCSKTTVARKLAAIRSFYRSLVERREIEANPADLVASPKRDSYLPRVLKPGEVAGLLQRIPASTPLELRDRAMFELAYAAGLRAEEIVNIDLTDLDADDEELRVEGKGGRTRIVPAGEHAWRAIESSEVTTITSSMQRLRGSFTIRSRKRASASRFRSSADSVPSSRPLATESPFTGTIAVVCKLSGTAPTEIQATG